MNYGAESNHIAVQLGWPWKGGSRVGLQVGGCINVGIGADYLHTERRRWRPPHLGETGPLSQGVQAHRKALRIRHINCMIVRKKMLRGFKKRPRGFK